MTIEPSNQTNPRGHIRDRTGGAYIGGSVTNEGGLNVFAVNAGDITHTDNRQMNAVGETTLKELFTALYPKDRGYNQRNARGQS